MPNLYPIAAILFAIGGICVVLGLLKRRHEQRLVLAAAGSGPLPVADVASKETTLPEGDLQALTGLGASPQVTVKASAPEASAAVPAKLIVARQPAPAPAPKSREGSHPYVPPPLPPRQKLTNADLPLARARSETQAPASPVLLNPAFVRPAVPPEPAVELYQPYVPPPLPPPQKLTMADIRRGRASIAKKPDDGRTDQKPSPIVTATLAAEKAAQVAASAARKRPRASRTSSAHPLRGTKYLLTYEDAFGGLSERKIRLERVFEDSGETRIMAHCYLRKERREFRLDRIISIIDAETGAFIADPQGFFGNWP